MAIGMIRSSFGRNSSSYNRATPKALLLCVMALGFGVCFGWSLSAPDTILLPDSLGPLRPGYHLAFGSSTNNIYVASESADIIVVDGNTFQRIKRINTGTPVGGALLVSQHNKLYCSYPSQGRIGVIDCATNSIVGSIEVGTRPKLLCYSSGSDKLYCGDTADRTVSVIDCATNALLKVIPVGKGLTAMAYDPTTNKVYAATQDAVLAISCPADSIVSTIPAVKAARVLCINKRRQKLYVAPPPFSGPDTVLVISTPTDSVAARMPCGVNSAPVLACNEVTDRLYAVDMDGGALYICEFDCVQDTVVRYRSVGSYITTVGLACDSVHNRLYYLYERDGGGYLLVLDCATFDVISETYVGVYPAILQADPARYRMMCLGWSSAAAALTVFDYKGDSSYPRGGVPLYGWVGNMCHNPATGKLYYWWGLGVGGVGVIDEQTNRVVAQAFLSEVNLSQLTYSRTSNKFYFHALGKGLGVIDGSRDSLLKVIAMGSGVWGPRPCWCPDRNKVYCSARAGLRMYIAVVDCDTDSVAREIDVYNGVQGFEYLGEGRMLCIQYEGLTLIDSRTDSVLVDTAIEASVWYAAAHSGDGEKVYLLLNGRLRVLSSSSLSLLATIAWPYGEYVGGGFLVCSDTTRKLYWFAGCGKDSVLAIDATSDTVVARFKTSASRDGACFDHTGRYLFCASPYDITLRVHDTQADSLVAMYPQLPYPVSITSSPEQHCIYVGCRDVILVYPDAPPGIHEQLLTSTSPKLPPQTVVREVLFLAGSPSSSPSTSCLLDVSGRKVMDLMSGANNVRALAPGVYFVCGKPQAASHRPQAVRKIVIAR